MSLSGISFGGLATGLDTKAIISALLAVERRPITALEQKKSALSRSKSLFNDFKSKLEALQEKAKAIKDIDSFLKFSAETDDEDKYFNVSASEQASPGKYGIKVNTLAAATTRVSAGSADKDTTAVVDATPFTFTFGDSSTLTISPSASMTLDELAAAINNADDGGSTQTKVRATVLDTGSTGADRYKLVLTALEEGTDAGFTVKGDTASSQTEAFFAAFTETSTAADAEIEVDGVKVTRSSNTIADAIQGLTITLKAVHPTTPTPEKTSVTIATDTEATSAKVKEFVDAYNEVVDFVKKQNALNDEGEAQGPLFGDVTLRQVRSALRSMVGDSVSTGNAAYALFSQVGITSDTDGKLTFNQADFDEALVDDSSAVKKLFSDTSSGIALQVFDRIDALTDSVDGIFKARIDGFDRQIRIADDQIEQKLRRLDIFEQRQIQKFAALESLIAQMQSQGSAFTAPQLPTS